MNHLISRAAIVALALAALFPLACTQTSPTNTPSAPSPAPVAAPQADLSEPLPFRDPTLSLDQRLDDLMSRLTLEEKVALMQMASPAIPRLGIASYDWWSEALHGVAMSGAATVFPQAIGMAAAWDPDLHYQVAKVIGLEGRAKHAYYIAHNNRGRFHGLDFWSPNINIFRDPRWGRGQETYGEDPYLTGRLAIVFVRGLQGDDPFYFQLIATPKHFAVHSGPEPLRHKFDAVVTNEDLFTTYLPQFEAAIREGHADSIMSSYNALDGIPNSGNKRLLTDILREKWGFNGYVVSDVDAVEDIYYSTSHAFVPDAAYASALAVKAGNDLNSGTTYGVARGKFGGLTSNSSTPSALASAVQDGLISEKQVDVSLRRLLTARFRLGEFDPPGYAANPYNKITADMNDSDASDAVAHQMADESMVLLKNDNHTLPLSPHIGTVAVIGPDADSLLMQYANYNGTPSARRRISILQGIETAVGADHVITTDAKLPLVNDRVALAEPISADYLFTDASRSRHGLTIAYAATAEMLLQPARTQVSDSGTLDMPQPDSAIDYDPTLAAKMTGVLVPPMTGDYELGAKGRDHFRITLDSQLVLDETEGGGLRVVGNVIHLEKDKPYNILIEYAHNPPPAEGAARGRGGQRRGPLFGASSQAPGVTASASSDPGQAPLVELAWTRPTADGDPADSSGQNLYSEAISLTQKADAVILVVGLDATLEREEAPVHAVGFAGGDRTTIDLPAVQENLIKQVKKAAGNKPVILVNCSGSAMALNWENENLPAILQAWYPGQHGDAVADVIFGQFNPAGRLPVTFYKTTDDLPDFTDYSMVNRTYRYFTQPVLYPFGYGLSYSTFEYSGLAVPDHAATDSDVSAQATVTNTSDIDGEEVVQCYINRDLPPIDPKTLPEISKRTDEQAIAASTPRKTLVGFCRIALKAGESKTVVFRITTQQLSLVVGNDGQRMVNPGKLQIQIGGSSAIGPGTLVQDLTLDGPPTAPEYHFAAPFVK